MDDLDFLQAKTRPGFENGELAVRLVDLFCGCGGMTLGLAEAARRLGLATDIALAVDSQSEIARVYRANFPKARVEETAVEAVFNGALGSPPSDRERRWRRLIGRVNWLQGGPPCQGHSDLNNHTRRDDPRNRFYERMARAAEVVNPAVVVIENVPTVLNDRGQVVDRVTEALVESGYRVANDVIALEDLGVPQKRRRHTILALKGVRVDPNDVLGSLGGAELTDLRWAIGDLEDPESYMPLDEPSRVSPDNCDRIAYLIEHDQYDLPNAMRPKCHQGDHSYKSMYGRLMWSEPAQTITTGFGSMGQGRYVHPSQPRTLTPHEAARIQGFPDWFDFTVSGAVLRRRTWATMIGNAVPPKLTMELGRLLLPHLSL
jgi:DNA (cytosine-5)-methyltransferase 1